MTSENKFPTVSRRDFLVALDKVRHESGLSGAVEIYELSSLDEAIRLGVNWPAKGTVPPEEAAKFAEEITRAAAAAAAFPYNGYVIDYVGGFSDDRS